MKLSGIIISDVCDYSMGALTEKRSVASIPFGGRYRFIDFALSNMTNSGITSIGAVTGSHYRSLMDHIGGGSPWDLNRKGANLFVFPPLSDNMCCRYRGNLEALGSAYDFIERTPSPYVLLCDSAVLCNIDYRQALDNHIKSGADVTIICNNTVKEYELSADDLFINLSGGDVKQLYSGYTAESGSLVGMGMYIISRTLIKDTVIKYKKRNKYSFERDFLIPGFFDGSLKVSVSVFEGPVFRNHNITAYFKNSFLINDNAIRNKIFNADAPIRTKVRDSGPTQVLQGATLTDCSIADGCVIRGSVRRSILFRDVTIEEGAVVTDSILMQGSHVGKNASVCCAITDKNTIVSAGSMLSGAPIAPIIIPKGETV